MVRNPQREILAYLLAGGRLTVQKASRLFETTELRKIVSRLRRRGRADGSSSRNTSSDRQPAPDNGRVM